MRVYNLGRILVPIGVAYPQKCVGTVRGAPLAVCHVHGDDDLPWRLARGQQPAALRIGAPWTTSEGGVHQQAEGLVQRLVLTLTLGVQQLLWRATHAQDGFLQEVLADMITFIRGHVVTFISHVSKYLVTWSHLSYMLVLGHIYSTCRQMVMFIGHVETCSDLFASFKQSSLYHVVSVQPRPLSVLPSLIFVYHINSRGLVHVGKNSVVA